MPNPFGEDKTGYAEQGPANALQPPQQVPYSERIMELYRRVGEAEAGLKEAAERIIRLEKRLGDI